MNESEGLELSVCYALFNGYLTHEAKTNITHFIDYLTRSGLGDNTLEVTLAKLVRDNDAINLNEHLLMNNLPEMSSKAMDKVIGKIMEFKGLPASDIAQYRNTFRRICENEIILKSNEIADTTERLNFIRQTDYKDQFSQTIKIDSFEEAASRDEDPLNGSGIKSSIQMINDCSPIGEYLNAQLVCVSGKPGCFAEFVEVTTDKGFINFRDLCKRFEAGEEFRTVSYHNGEFIPTKIKDVFISKHVDELLTLTFEDGSAVKCTRDHKFLTKMNGWVAAEDLTYSDVIEDAKTKGYIGIIDKKLQKLDFEVPVYDLEVDHECHNFALSNGAIAHNSGKSLFAMAESIEACKAGKRVMYVAAGDLVPSDFLIRMSAQALHIPVSEVYNNPKHYIEKTIEILGGKFKFTCVPSQVLQAEELVNYFMARIDDFDMFVVDYDTNIATGAESMYDAGGVLYDELTKLSRAGGGKLVFILSQPKINFYDNDYIPLQGLAESSRKQQILDMQITIGKAPKSAYSTGYIAVVKNRRGKMDKVPYQISSSLNHVEIHPSRYDTISANPVEPTAWQNSYEYIKKESNSFANGEKEGLSNKEDADMAFKELVASPPPSITPEPSQGNVTNETKLPF